MTPSAQTSLIEMDMAICPPGGPWTYRRVQTFPRADAVSLKDHWHAESTRLWALLGVPPQSATIICKAGEMISY